jgi:hypothetical protein
MAAPQAGAAHNDLRFAAGELSGRQESRVNSAVLYYLPRRAAKNVAQQIIVASYMDETQTSG